jgi:hypothetical protein
MILTELVHKASWHEPSFFILQGFLDILKRGIAMNFSSAKSPTLQLVYDVLTHIGRR